MRRKLDLATTGRIHCNTVPRNNCVCRSASFRSGESTSELSIGASRTTSNWVKQATRSVRIVSSCWELKCLVTRGRSFFPLAGVIKEMNGCGSLDIRIS